jgi:hypothetical protein
MPPLYDSISHVTVGVCLKNESHSGRERLGGSAGRTLATIRSQSMASLAWRAVIYEWSKRAFDEEHRHASDSTLLWDHHQDVLQSA